MSVDILCFRAFGSKKMPEMLRNNTSYKIVVNHKISWCRHNLYHEVPIRQRSSVRFYWLHLQASRRKNIKYLCHIASKIKLSSTRNLKLRQACAINWNHSCSMKDKIQTSATTRAMDCTSNGTTLMISPFELKLKCPKCFQPIHASLFTLNFLRHNCNSTRIDAYFLKNLYIFPHAQ